MGKDRITTLLAVILVIAGIYMIFQGTGSVEEKKYPIRFYSYDEGLKVAEREGKPVLIYIHSDTCHVCKAFLEDLSKYRDLQNAMNRFIVIKVDFSTERLLAMKFGATGTPEFHVLYPNGTVMKVNGMKMVYIGYSNTPDNEMARKSLISFLDLAIKEFEKQKAIL